MEWKSVPMEERLCSVKNISTAIGEGARIGVKEPFLSYSK